MNSYTSLINQYTTLTNNTETANVNFGTLMINQGISEILAMPVSWKFLETSKVIPTIANIPAYVLPVDYEKMISVKVQNGTYQFISKQVKNRDLFNQLTAVPFTSDYVTNYYIDSRTVLLYPTPASSGNNITLYYKKLAKEINAANYTTGTITATFDDATITGSGTTFTAAMIGRYLQTQDGYWYLIADVTSTTTLELEQPYQGTTGAGLPYIIGQMSVLPANYDEAPVYYAVYQYWNQNNDLPRAQHYERMWNEKIKQLKDNFITTSFDPGGDPQVQIINPNDYPQNIT